MVFASVADDENYFAAFSRPLRKIKRSLQNGVIEYVRFLLARRRSDSGIGIDRHVVDSWTLRTKRSIGNRRPIVSSARGGQCCEPLRQLVTDCCPARDLAYNIAIAVDRNLVERTEDSLECGKGVVNLLHIHIFHAQIENDGGGKGERIAGKEI